MRQGVRQGSRWLIVLVSVILLLSPTFQVHPVNAAAPIEVTTTSDDFGTLDGATCSLREAVQAVYLGTSFGGCSNPGGVTSIHVPSNPSPYLISLVGTGVYEANNEWGDINIRNDLTISGDGYDTVINGNSIDRVFRIANDQTVTLNSMTIEYGSASTNGGGIFNAGNLTLNFVAVGHNATLGNGGGIYSSFDGASVPYLNLNYSMVYQNTATNSGGKGGGIANNGGHIDLTYTDVDYNTAYSDGGGIWSTTGYTTALTRGLVYTNTSQHGSGGDIFNRGPMNLDYMRVYNGNANVDGGDIYTGAPGDGGAIMNITNSDVSFGYAAGNGGGIANDGVLGMQNVSFSWDSSSHGGGLYTVEPSATTTLDHVTMSSNLAGIAGGSNIYNDYPSNPVVVHNTILDSGISSGCVGAVAATSTYSIDSSTSCSLPSGVGFHNLSSTDPLLGAFDFYGGPSRTFPIAKASPAVDAADDTGCPVTDQRGVYRPIDGNRDGIARCDIGAYELESQLFLPITIK